MDKWAQLGPDEALLHTNLLALEAGVHSDIHDLATSSGPVSKAQQVAVSNKIGDGFTALRTQMRQLELLADEQDTYAYFRH
jgi:hypothetical protein